MVGQLPPVVAAGQGQLPVHGRRVHPDAHGRDFKGAAQQIIPEHNVPVETPVVVVRGPPVMGLAGAQRRADADDKGGAMLLQIGVFPLLGRHLRVSILQLLGGDKADLPLQLGQDGKLGIDGLHGILGVADGADDVHHRQLQIVQVPVLRQDHLFPVPLIHIDRVQVIQLVLIPADGVHIGVQALAGVEAIAFQRQTLPLGQRLHHLCPPVGAEDVKGHWPLDAVQVIVQAGLLIHKQGCRHPVKVQLGPQIVLKQPL